MSELEGPPKMCLACGLPGRTSFHFGGSSCTACASFFRRTVSLNIKYVCKRDEDCISSPELRSICRACRYKSCVDKAGLNREFVQPRRNDKRIPKYILDSRKSDGVGAEVVRDYTTNSYTTLHEFSPMTSGSIHSEEEQEEEEEKNEDVENQRKILNISDDGLLEFYVDTIQKLTLKMNTLQVKSVKELLDVFLVHQPLALEICTTCPGVDLLEKEDLQVLYNYSFFSSVWLESAWIVDGTDTKENMNTTDNLVIEYIAHFRHTVCPSLLRLQLDVVEFAALKSFCMWKLGVHNSSLALKIVAQEHYMGITTALRNYYEKTKKLQPFEIATRIAEITLLIAPIFGIYRDMMVLYEKIGFSIETGLVEE